MNTKTLPAAAQLAAPMPGAARFILRLLARLEHGALVVVTPAGEHLRFGDASVPVTLELRDWSVFGAALRSGDIGFAEAYISGAWHCDNLTGLLSLLVRNRTALEQLVYGSWWGNLVYRLKHLLRRNTRAGSRKNIHAHYDIGNDFYQLWLDPSMSYSSALFTPETKGNLQLAQAAKYRAVIEQLDIGSGARVLEIGCGWGAFAELAAREAGAHVTGLTLSTEQLAHAQARMAQAGLAEQADLHLCDYRDCDGQYDAIASIEMFEAVGEDFWPSYFECLARNLKPGGLACIQTITIADELFERYRRGTDFIQQYIFPGGMLPSPSVFVRMAGEHGLALVHERRFGIDYADTLVAWRTAFQARLDAVRAQGFDERFVRTWEFYLCYCEAAFRGGNTDVMHFTLKKV